MRLRGETEHDTNDNVTIKGIASAWWKPSTTPMTTWTKIQTDFHTKHMKLYTWHEHVFSPFVCSVLFCLRQHIMSCTPHRGSSFTCARHLMVITWWAHLFDLESSIPFHCLIFSFILNLLHFPLHFFHYIEGSSNTAYFAWKEMDSLDDSCLLTGYEPNAYDLKETYVESYKESLTHPQFSEQGFLEDGDYDDASQCTPSTCLSLPARRLVCRSVVVVRVRANGEIRWIANRATCWTNWSGAKCCKCTD